MNRPYFALNGLEIVDVVISELKKSMLTSGNFPVNKTFPEVSWKWSIEFEVYPSEPKFMHHKHEGREFKDEPRIGPNKVTIEGGREGVGKTVAPDKVRIEEGLKLSKPVTKRNVGTVDELVDSLEQTQKR